MRSDTEILNISWSEDTLMIFCCKLTAIANVVTSEKSVIIVTDYSAVISQEQHSV